MQNTLLLGAIFLLLAASLYIGIRSKNASTAAAFIGSAKSFGSIPVALSSVAALASGWMIVGMPAVVYSSGNFLTLNCLMAGGFALSYVLIGKKVRALAEVTPVATIGDLIEARYNCKKVRLMSTLVLFLGCFSYLASQIAAGASLLTYLFGWEVFFGAVLMFGVVIVYVAVGGESAGLMSQAFQGLIMFIVGAVVIGIFFWQGGFPGLYQGVMKNPVVTGANGVSSNFGMINFTAYGTASQAQTATWFTLAWVGTVCQPAILTRMYALKDPRELPKLGIQTGITQATVSFFGLTIGYLAVLLVATGQMEPLAKPAFTTWAIGSYLGPVMQVLLYTAAIAAIISSASMYLSIASSVFSHDILKTMGVKLTDERQIRIARICIVLVGVVGILLASFSGETVALLGALGWATFVTIFLPVVAIGMVWKKANARGMGAAAATALIGNIAGLLIVGFSNFKWPLGMPWYMYLIAASTSIGIIVSYLTSKKDEISKPVQEALKM